MSKRKATTIVNITFLICITMVIFLIPNHVANANSAPPPSVLWFTFDYRTAQTPKLLGVQLIGCVTVNCEQPVLLQQYGICDSAGCITVPATLSDQPNAFGCTENKCRSAAYPNHGGTGFKLIALFSDRVRMSGVVNKLPSEYGEVTAWHVIVREADLSIEHDTTIPAIQDPFGLLEQNLGRVGLSIVMELLVAGLCFQLWAKTDIRRLAGRLLIILLVNLVSLPVVWLFFPSLGQFQPGGSRVFGVFVLIVAVFYAALLAGIYRSADKARRWAIILTLVSLPVTGFSCLAMLFMSSYAGGYTVIVQGLPSNVTIFTSEVFAVVFEAILITILSKRSIPTRLIWTTSLLMNAASFVLGQLLIRIQF